MANAGTAKTTLYKVFGSKDGLVEAVLEREGRAWRAWFIAGIDVPAVRRPSASPPPASTQALVRAAADFYGCPFINAVGESDKADDRMRTLAIAHKKIVLERIAALCAEAGFAAPIEVAHALGLVIDGAIVAALVTREPAIADTAGRACASVLSAARG